MDARRLRSIICSCKSNDIKPLLTQWGRQIQCQNVVSVNYSDSKKSIAQALSSICQSRKHFKTEVDELDLKCTQMYPKKRLWKVFHLKDKSDNTTNKWLDLCNPQKFKKKFKSQSELYFDNVTSVCVGVHQGALWTRLYATNTVNRQQDQSYLPSNTVYIVYFPKTEYVIMSRYKLSTEEYLHQAILTTLGATEMTNMQLCGHDLYSLIHLAMNRKCQGSFSKFNSKQDQRQPFAGFEPKKRKAIEIEKDDKIFCEDEETMKKRAKILEKSFGQEEQPCLEKVEYRVKTKFRGTDYVPSMARRQEAFKCTVKFEGSSVLEGIRNLGATGLASVPLPGHLANVHSLAKNHFVIQDQETTPKKRRK
ncbi:centromere protein N-like isoform X2 [Pecten maximus]|uniref:centromere protein N-like isoform X2 n=1 Tax=Pecten maximus TaxID=6579 RepID=UPI001458BEE5|nr:centromere protein N-like isoform X2 [Pecten maximus]